MKKILIFLVVAITLYMGLHYWLRHKRTITDDVTKLGRLVDCDPNSISGFQINRTKESVTYERKDETAPGTPTTLSLENSEWYASGFVKGEADSSLFSRLATMVCETYDPLPVKDSDFQPLPNGEKASIAFTEIKEGKKLNHLIGFGAQSSDRMTLIQYVSASGSVSTYKIPTKLYQLVAQPAKATLNRRVARVKSDNIMKVVVKKKKGLFHLERNDSGWTVLEGKKTLGTSPAEADKFINRITTLLAIDISADGLSPQYCEPKSADYEVNLSGVTGQGESVFFTVGKTGPLKACSSARNTLFFVHRDFLKFLQVTGASLL